MKTRSSRLGAALTILVTAFALFLSSAHAADVTSTWKGLTGNWGVNANWTNTPFAGGFPSNGNAGVATYDAVVGSGTVTLDQHITIQKFTQSGGTVNGNFNLTANELHSWTGGILSGIGTNFANGGLVLRGVLSLSQRMLLPMVSATLTNCGLTVGSGAVISNKTGVNFTLQDDSSLFNAGGSPAILNQGTFEKIGAGNNASSVGTGISRIDVPLHNNGVVQATAGTLRLNGGGVSRGTLTPGAGARIQFVNNYTLDGGTLNGGGTAEVTTATTTLSNNVNATVATMLHAGGTLGGPGNLTSSGQYNWTGGIESGAGTNTLNGPLAISGVVTLSQRTLLPMVSTILTNCGLSLNSGAVISNKTGVNFTLQDDSSVFSGGGSPAIHNQGTIEKIGAGNNSSGVGTGLSRIDAPLHNNSVVQVTAGTLRINGGGVSRGTLTAGAGARIQLMNNYTLDGGTINGGGTVEVSSVTLTLSNNVNATVATLLHAGGTLGGPGSLTSSGQYNWTSGTESGAGTNILNGPLAISGMVTLSQRTLLPMVSTMLTNCGLTVGSGAVISNQAGVNFTLQDDSSVFNAGGGPAILNQGTLEKIGAGNNSSGVGTGLSRIDAPLYNGNVVQATAGTLRLNGGGGSRGTLTAGAGARIQFANNYTLDGGTLNGGGTVEVNSGTTTLSNNVNATVATVLHSGGALGGPGNLTCSGQYNWTGGTESGPGTNTLNGPLAIDGAISLNQRMLLSMVSATITNSGVSGSSGAVIHNAPGAMFDLRDDSSLFNLGGGGPSFQNAGTFVKSGSGNNSSGVGAGISRIDWPFNNSGKVCAQSGTLRFNSSYIQTAGSIVLTGGVISASVPLDIRGGNMIGSGIIVGNVTNNGTIAPGFSAGNLQIQGNLTCLNNSKLSVELGGTTQSTEYDFVNVSGAVTLAGMLEVRFINGFQAAIPNGATFTVLLASNSLSGAFANVASGQRLATADGLGSFLVTYSGVTRTVVLSDFQASSVPVMANFSGSPTNGPAPLMVGFVNQTTGSAAGYLWSFGDGTSSTALNPSHTYTNVGTYTVSLTASGPGGTNTNIKTSFITVASVAQPVADFSANPTNGTAPLMVSFTDQSSGTITSYFWSFGDGASSTAVNPTHTYTNAGTFTVSLTVSGPGGTNTITKVNLITVAPPPTVCTPAPGGLVGWWPGDGNANDIIGGNNGTLQGGATFAAGMVGPAFSFDGVNDSVKINAASSLNVGAGSGLTVDAWINPSELSVQRPIVEWNNGAGFIGAHLWISVTFGGAVGPGNVYANLVDTNGSYHTISSAPNLIATNVHQHVAVTYDKTTGISTLYLNGTAVAQQNLGIFSPQTSSDLYLGFRPSGVDAGKTYNGAIDEVEVFNRPLLAAEIQAIYNAGSAGKCKGTNFVVCGVGPTFWPRPDFDAGVAGFVIENFEDTNLVAGLRIGWETPAGTNAPSNTLPAVFNPALDPFGNVFNAGVWDGTNGLLNTRDNQSHTYSQAQHWGDLILLFDPPVAAVGFSLEQASSPVTLIVNGVTLGNLATLGGLSSSSGRLGYFTIRGEMGSTISSIKLDNSSGDGFLLDHLAILPTMSPGLNFAVIGFSPATWPRPDPELGITGYTIENFEDLILAPGLRVGWETAAGTNLPSAILPNLFNPLLQDPFGNAFNAGVWDGTNVLINTRDNQSHTYSAVVNWGDVIFQFIPPVRSVGFSIQQADFEAQLAINGVSRGCLSDLTGLSTSGGRQGYVRIDMADSELISEVRVVNGKNSFNDGIAFDHFAFLPATSAGCTLVCPVNVIVTNTPGQCGAIASYPLPTASGDCGPVTCTPPSGSFFSVGNTIVSCTTTNPGADCLFTITVNDTQPPAVACPANIVRTTDSGQCSASNVTFNVTATDNCPGATTICTPPSGATFPKGVTTVNCAVTDAASNTNRCAFTVTVNDTQPPAITCPAPLVRSADPGQCTAANVTYAVTATDNCPGVTTICAPPSGSTFPTGITTVNCVATDAASNTNQCSFTVTITDTQPPVITCPANVVTNVAGGQTSSVVNYPAPAATDNCPGVTASCTPPSGSTFAVGATTVSCTARDGVSNTTACSFTVAVNSSSTTNTPPTINCAANITTNNAPDQCTRTLAFTTTVTGNPAPTVTCRVGSTVITSPNSFPVGTTTVTCTASNVAGVASCSFTVTINDTQPPAIPCPAALALQCDTDVPAPNPAAVTATDNCAPAPVVVHVGDVAVGACPKIITRTYQATDAAGNMSTCTQTITVRDTNAPVIAGCSNLTVAAPSGQLGTAVNFAVTATDNCDGNIQVNCTPRSGSYCALGQTPVMCEAVDRCGNRASCTFTVTVTATTDALRACSFTQGFYGNSNGKYNGNTSRTLVGQLLGQGPLVVGKTGRSLSIQPSDAALLQLRLPSGGTPAALPNNGDQMLQTAVLPLNPKGRFANVFLGQTITLSLNTRLSAALRTFGLASNFCSQGVLAGPDGLKSTADDVLIVGDIQRFSIPASVLSALLDSALGVNDLTVRGLLELANRALAGMPTSGASLSDINAAVDAINRGFDECRALANCATSTVVQDSFNDGFTNRPALGSGGVPAPPPEEPADPDALPHPPPVPSLNIRIRSSNLTAVKEVGEPMIAGNPGGGKSVWWQWRAPLTGPVTISTAGSSFDTLLGVYTGTTLSNLVLVASNDDARATLQSEVTFQAQAGTDYQIVVDGVDGASGEIVLTLIVDPPRLCLPVIVAGNQVECCLIGDSQRIYTVEASPDLTNWTLVDTALNSDGTLRFTDPARSNFPQRYYRVTFEP